MLRAYLVIIVAMAIAASLVSRAPSLHPTAQQQDEIRVAPPSSGDDAHPDQIASNLDGAVVLQRSDNGHFYADVEINGVPVHMLVDTGASGIALSRDDARRAAIATSIGMNDVVGQGADGSVHGEWVIIDRMTLGPKSVEQTPALVLNGGQQSLLGQTFLKQFASVEIHGDTMTLR